MDFIVKNVDKVLPMFIRFKFDTLEFVIIDDIIFFVFSDSSVIMIMDGIIKLVELDIVLSDLLRVKFTRDFTESFLEFFRLIDSFDTALGSFTKEDFFFLSSKFARFLRRGMLRTFSSS